MKQIALINIENVPEEEADKYDTREAVRAIVLDNEKKIGLIYSTQRGYYTLPGGGIELGETKEVALLRECKEEIGCDIKIIQELGSTLEYHNQHKLRQTSYCYIAKVVGEKGISSLTFEESEKGFETVWLSYDDALAKICGSEGGYERPHMGPRNIAVLEAARGLIK